MGLQPGGLDDHKDHVKQLIETVAFCKNQACTIIPGGLCPRYPTFIWHVCWYPSSDTDHELLLCSMAPECRAGNQLDGIAASQLVVNPEPEAKPAQEAAKPAAAKVTKKRTASDAQGKKSKQVEAKQTGRFVRGLPIQALSAMRSFHSMLC